MMEKACENCGEIKSIEGFKEVKMFGSLVRRKTCDDCYEDGYIHPKRINKIKKKEMDSKMKNYLSSKLNAIATKTAMTQSTQYVVALKNMRAILDELIQINE